MQKYYVHNGAMTIEPVSHQPGSAIYLASEADAKIAALEEDNRKLRHFAEFAKGTTDFPVAKAAREVLAMVGENSVL